MDIEIVVEVLENGQPSVQPIGSVEVGSNQTLPIRWTLITVPEDASPATFNPPGSLPGIELISLIPNEVTLESTTQTSDTEWQIELTNHLSSPSAFHNLHYRVNYILDGHLHQHPDPVIVVTGEPVPPVG